MHYRETCQVGPITYWIHHLCGSMIETSENNRWKWKIRRRKVDKSTEARGRKKLPYLSFTKQKKKVWDI